MYDISESKITTRRRDIVVAERGFASSNPVVIMADGRALRRRKNAAKIYLQQTVLQLEEEIDAGGLSNLEIHAKLKVTTRCFQEFQELCAGYAEYLQEGFSSDQMAKLEAECREMEEMFVEVQTLAVEFINRTRSMEESRERSSRTELKSRLFQKVLQPEVGADVHRPYMETPSSYYEMKREVRCGFEDPSTETTLEDEEAREERSRSSVAEASGTSLMSVGTYRDFAQNVRCSSYEEYTRQQKEADVPEMTGRFQKLNPASTPFAPGRLKHRFAGQDDLSREETLEQVTWEEPSAEQLSHCQSYAEYKTLTTQPPQGKTDRSQQTSDWNVAVKSRSQQMGRRVASTTDCSQQYSEQRGDGWQGAMSREPAPRPQERIVIREAPRRRESYLTKVAVPIFKGDQREFPGWWAAFRASVDLEDIPITIKLLRLREVLQGEAAQVLSALDHSDAAYFAAMERLDEKYGGERRHMLLRMGDINKMKSVRDGSASEMEKFTEMVEALVISIKDGPQKGELGSGALYLSLQQKLSEEMLAKYDDWVFNTGKKESVLTLKTFVKRQASSMIKACETKYGVGKPRRESKRPDVKTHVGTSPDAKPPEEKPTQLTGKKKGWAWKLKCRMCSEKHGLWGCPMFQELSVDDRWAKAKELHVCFKCLNLSHQGEKCPRAKLCGIDDCPYYHHKLLHNKERWAQKRAKEKEGAGPVSMIAAAESGRDPELSTSIVMATQGDEGVYTAFRTLPVLLYWRKKLIRVNAMMDDGSSQTWITEATAYALQLSGEYSEVLVSTLEGRTTLVKGRRVEVNL